MAASKINDAPSGKSRSFLAGVLAVLVHVAFIVVLIFGFNWQDRPSEDMTVDLWQDLPQPVKPVPPIQPEPTPTPTPTPKADPKPQRVEPEPIQVTPPPSKKPDIAFKREAEQPKPVQKAPEPDPEVQKKKAQEQAAKEEAEARAEAERLQREREIEKQRELEAQKKRELEEQQKREQAEKARLEAQQVAARAKIANEIAQYKGMILAKIKSRIVMPPDLPGNPVVEFNVTLLPGGDILNVKLHKSSGYSNFDDAVERAIFLSQPLPLPLNRSLFNEFRNLQVTVHYLE